MKHRFGSDCVKPTEHEDRCPTVGNFFRHQSMKWDDAYSNRCRLRLAFFAACEPIASGAKSSCHWT